MFEWDDVISVKAFHEWFRANLASVSCNQLQDFSLPLGKQATHHLLNQYSVTGISRIGSLLGGWQGVYLFILVKAFAIGTFSDLSFNKLYVYS